MIKPCVTGFDVFDKNGKLVKHVLSFAEATELHEKVDPPAKGKRHRPVKLTERQKRFQQRSGGAYDRAWKSRALSVPIEQLNEMNEGAHKAGTGARYVPDPRNRGFAIAECESRRSRNAELKRRGYHDRDAGYGDVTAPW